MKKSLKWFIIALVLFLVEFIDIIIIVVVFTMAMYIAVTGEFP